jgi:hypothetical protein
MTVDEFREWLDRCGGDLSRWPAAKMVEASRLLATSLEAQSALDEMVSIEVALAEEGMGTQAPEGLANRIFAAAFGDEDESAVPERRPRVPR